MATMATSRILELAHLITIQATVIYQHLQDNNLPEPSFSQNGPPDIPNPTPELTAARNKAIEATIELRQLLEGPVKLLLPETNFSPLAAVNHFRIASHVPLDGVISFEELAQICGLRECDLKRIVRFTSVHHRVFCEVEKGFVGHSCASRLLYESEMGVEGKGFIQDLMGLTFEECWPAHGRVSNLFRWFEM